MTRWIMLVFLALGLVASVGCNTVHGLGKDIEKGGEKLQDVSGKGDQDW